MSATTRPVTSRLLLTAIRTWALLLIALHLFSPLFTESWAWGIWPAVYVPAVWRIALGVFAALTVLFGEAAWRRLGPPALALASRLDWRSSWVRLGVAGLAVIPFYAFRLRHLRWGDAALIVKALPDPYRITYIWQAPLDIYIHARGWQLGNRLFGWPDPVPVYYILSTLAGVAFVWVLLGLAATLGRNRTERLLVAGLVLTLGTMQLFFGYIENYPIMTAGILLYAWLGLRNLRSEVRIVWPATVLAITHAFHPSTIILAPSLLYLLWRAPLLPPGNPVAAKNVLSEKGSEAPRDAEHREGSVYSHPSVTASLLLSGDNTRRSGQQPRVAPLLSVVLPYLVVFAGVVALMTAGNHGVDALLGADFPGGGDRQWFVPLFKVTTEWQHYTMFSLGHLIDIVNQQLLTAPMVWPVLLLAALIAWRRLPWREPHFRFLAIMAGSYMLLTLTWNPDYGGQKDWDLFSPAAVPAALLLATVLPRVSPGPRTLQVAGWAIVAAQAFHTFAWVYSNTLPAR